MMINTDKLKPALAAMAIAKKIKQDVCDEWLQLGAEAKHARSEEFDARLVAAEDAYHQACERIACDVAELVEDAEQEGPASGWISVDAQLKPPGRSVILVAVSFVRYGEHENGTLDEFHGWEVTEGQYLPRFGEAGDYFESFSSPHGDREHITHWMPLPPPPAA